MSLIGTWVETWDSVAPPWTLGYALRLRITAALVGLTLRVGTSSDPLAPKERLFRWCHSVGQSIAKVVDWGRCLKFRRKEIATPVEGECPDHRFSVRGLDESRQEETIARQVTNYLVMMAHDQRVRETRIIRSVCKKSNLDWCCIQFRLEPLVIKQHLKFYLFQVLALCWVIDWLAQSPAIYYSFWSWGWNDKVYGYFANQIFKTCIACK